MEPRTLRTKNLQSLGLEAGFPASSFTSFTSLQTEARWDTQARLTDRSHTSCIKMLKPDAQVIYEHNTKNYACGEGFPPIISAGISAALHRDTRSKQGMRCDS